jgi:hypothetical protein
LALRAVARICHISGADYLMLGQIEPRLTRTLGIEPKVHGANPSQWPMVAMHNMHDWFRQQCINQGRLVSPTRNY